MNASRRIRVAKSKREPGGFVALPNIVLRSEHFARLSSHAVKLLMDLLAQHRLGNNGDLCAPWTRMHARGWKSRDTLARALAELIERGFVSQTRQGGRHAASLYGVTFYALDENPKLDIDPSTFPRGAWARGQPGDGPTRQRRCHAGRVDSGAIDTPAVSPRAAVHAN